VPRGQGLSGVFLPFAVSPQTTITPQRRQRSMPVTVTGNHPRPLEPFTQIRSPFSVHRAPPSSSLEGSGQHTSKGGGGSASRFASFTNFSISSYSARKQKVANRTRGLMQSASASIIRWAADGGSFPRLGTRNQTGPLPSTGLASSDCPSATTLPLRMRKLKHAQTWSRRQDQIGANRFGISPRFGSGPLRMQKRAQMCNGVT
jgi:hypothetical protein